MRVTQSITTRNYIRNIQRNAKARMDSETRTMSGARFTRGSQDPMSAARALNVRKSMSDLKTYRDNLTTAKNIYASAETVVLEISDTITNINEKINYAVNGTLDQNQRDILADEIEGYANQMVKNFNLRTAGRQIFGGESNDNSPFKIETDDSGNKFVSYNGEAVNSHQSYEDFPYSEKVIIDVGIGFEVDADGKIDPQSGLAISFNGAEITGSGLDEDGDAKNYIQLTLDAASALRNGDIDGARKLMDKIEASRNHVSMTIADIGSGQNFIEFNQERITQDEYNLSEKQNDIEATDKVEELSYYKVLTATYSATLSMASYVVPQTIFNFIN